MSAFDTLAWVLRLLGLGTTNYAHPTRFATADPLNRQYCADYQSHANGGGIKDAQGATSCALRAAFCAPVVSYSAGSHNPAAQLHPSAVGNARGAQTRHYADWR